MDDKDNDKKSLTERITDTVKDIVDTTSEAAMKALKPSGPEHAEEVNEQMLVGDAAIAPEAIPAPVEPRKRTAPLKRANKRVAKAKEAAPKAASKKAKKAVKKTTKKTAKKSAKKAKSSAGKKKTAKKVAKKKKAKKSKR